MYLSYHEETKDEAQQKIWTFYEAIKIIIVEQITTDHTFVQDLIDDGTLSQYQADHHPLRNMLDQCVGCPTIRPDSSSFPVLPGDRILLCSDGLTRQVPVDKIGPVLDMHNARTVSEQLVSLALEAGGKDNVTVVILICGNNFIGY